MTTYEASVATAAPRETIWRVLSMHGQRQD